ncbi:sulfotransferase [Tropicimonas sediminicola]|uniref:Sulfotransferase family protein n=1 Tax=Tropicimonas sediminicola TaxID=1031541 RepID=A0A239MGE3_9RHOB|nr:sulfotransferase [Tropicimonas sediminicola]SNT40879.1 Sulfotransferase family protein [Tropicimonas sediminicola]
MFDNQLDDTQKERAVRDAGLRLLLGAWQITWRFGLALGATVLPILLADEFGFVPFDTTLGVLLRVDFIVVVSIVAIALGWFASNRIGDAPHKTSTTGQQDVGNKMFHTLAFASPRALRLAAKLDDRLYGTQLSRVRTTPPIFITSLARGGTTAVLNSMHGLPQVATHLYRDMPLITAPMLWSKLGGKNRAVARQKRAHGDGMEIDFDSPEAFDEVLWTLFWPEKYSDDGIQLWDKPDANEEARQEFELHFKKITLLRRPDSATGEDLKVRYLSKNNANIARLRLLPDMFPGCDIVVPLRHPSAHAASLLRQHENFSSLHAEDPFVLRYMRDIGHFEFGALHRPIFFDDWSTDGRSPEEPDYWLAYWVAAFKEVESHASDLHILPQDDLRATPDRTMTRLLDMLDLEAPGEFSSFFRHTPDQRPSHLFSPSLLKEAEDIYAALLGHAGRAPRARLKHDLEQ